MWPRAFVGAKIWVRSLLTKASSVLALAEFEAVSWHTAVEATFGSFGPYSYFAKFRLHFKNFGNFIPEEIAGTEVKLFHIVVIGQKRVIVCFVAIDDLL